MPIIVTITSLTYLKSNIRSICVSCGYICGYMLTEIQTTMELYNVTDTQTGDNHAKRHLKAFMFCLLNIM